jgi:hypothetical protein
MGYGLMDAGRNTLAAGEAGFSAASKIEQQREAANRGIAAARQNAKMSTMGSLAGAGLQYGLSTAGSAALGSSGMGALMGAGPYGALIGAGLGLLLGELF